MSAVEKRAEAEWLLKPAARLSPLDESHARQELAEIASAAREEGLARLEWAVLDWNAPSIAFYQRLGARPMDDWTVYRLAGDALLALGAEQAR